MTTSYNTVDQFEQVIADYYGAPYAVAVDCCTHAIELCLRLIKPSRVTCPVRTYVSVPFTFVKLGIQWTWDQTDWKDFYQIGNTNIIDSAVHWQENSYISGTLTCLSFQFKKHLSLGRGGMILLDHHDQYQQLRKMSHDGRSRDSAWADQPISTVGYHYYMTPETARLGLEKFNAARDSCPQRWSSLDYPELNQLPVFN